jgi:DNA-binding transcriptional ArsR family regulator
MMRKQPVASASRRTPAGAGGCGPPRPALRDRPLLSVADAAKVMALFKVLASDTRLRLLHHLVRSGEATVTGLATALGMKPQAVSNQLVRLADTGMLASRRDGNHMYYRVVNGCVPPLLDLALCLMEDEGRQGECHV